MTIRNVLRALAWLAIAAVLLYLLLARPESLRRLVQSIAGLPATLWLKLLAAWMFGTAMRTLRWHLLIRRFGPDLSYTRQTVIYLAGFAMALTPGKLGESIRSPYLKQHGVKYAHSLAAFGADRLYDLIAVTIIALGALELIAGRSDWFWQALAIMAAGLALLQTPWALQLVNAVCRWQRLTPVRESLLAGLTLVRGRILLMGLGLSLATWLSFTSSLWFTLVAIGEPLPIMDAMPSYAMALLAGAASFIPGGLGATEAAMTWLLTHQGISLASAVAAAVVSRGASLWWSVFVGLCCLAWLGGGRSAHR
ncbi:lysylphosphatidylglycerol synthase transmembrane domain-containing protein [Hydrogenophaga sp. 5NK40-0174]|uniref:lysylphosphatidylglycerol synthase transmembrane domain-containing protein n=1 Tax=Hydrogenophaga sp. 5NK40-0174 TaxID=3127649 RepID=UPI003109152E